MIARVACLTMAVCFLAQCKGGAVADASPDVPGAGIEAAELGRSFDPQPHVVRVHATRQQWDVAQPWEKTPPQRRSSLGVVVGPHQVLTTAEVAADATIIELESTDGLTLTTARVRAMDYGANLALLEAEDDSADKLFESLRPAVLAPPLPLGTRATAVQAQNNGNILVTEGVLRGVEEKSSFVPGEFFLTYRLKASMQNAASSFTIPVFAGGGLVGMLTNYDSKDQICDVIASPVIDLFLKDAADGDYVGFPTLGVRVATTEDSKFRKWLKLPEDGGGIYLSKITKGSAAAKAGLQEGDVITAIDGFLIDRLGYYEHPVFGRLLWSHLIKGAQPAGSTVKAAVLREGGPLDIDVVLDMEDPSKRLIPIHTFDRAPNYLVKGGFIFQELTLPVLQAFGGNWQQEAPLNLLELVQDPEPYQERMERAIFVSGVIPTPATVGYEEMQNLVVTQVDGKNIRNMADLKEAFSAAPEGGNFEIRFDRQDFPIYLSQQMSDAVDQELMLRGLSRLSRVE